MKRFAVWAVYGTRDNKVNQRIGEYPYKDKTEAEQRAKDVPNGYVIMEKVEK